MLYNNHIVNLPFELGRLHQLRVLSTCLRFKGISVVLLARLPCPLYHVTTCLFCLSTSLSLFLSLYLSCFFVSLYSFLSSLFLSLYLLFLCLSLLVCFLLCLSLASLSLSTRPFLRCFYLCLSLFLVISHLMHLAGSVTIITSAFQLKLLARSISGVSITPHISCVRN